jgi:hypothetical protein
VFRVFRGFKGFRETKVLGVFRVLPDPQELREIKGK